MISGSDRYSFANSDDGSYDFISSINKELYDVNFIPDDIVKQIESLDSVKVALVIDQIANRAIAVSQQPSDSTDDGFCNRVFSVLDQLEQNDELSYFSKLLIRDTKYLIYEYIDYRDGGRIYDPYMLGIKECEGRTGRYIYNDLLYGRDESWQAEQARIQKEHQDLLEYNENYLSEHRNTYTYYEQISRDCVAIREWNSHRIIHAIEYTNAGVNNHYYFTSDQRESSYDYELMDILLRPHIALQLKEKLGFSISELSLLSQKQILNYAVSVEESTFYRLQRSLAGINSVQDKVMFAESFLALEFGDDFGEPLLDVIEKAGTERSLEVQRALIAITDSLRNIDMLKEEFLAGINREWADSIRKGVSTRIAEVLYELSNRLDSPKSSAITSALDALESIREWSEGAYKMLVESEPIVVAQEGDTMLFHFMHPREGLLPGAVECTSYGKSTDDMTPAEKKLKEGRGARFSITYDTKLKDAALSHDGKDRRKALNGRFDKSTYNSTTGVTDPSADEAEVSFDMFSHHSGGRSGAAATIISQGRAARTGEKGAYTYDIINQAWGNKEAFAGLVHLVQQQLLERNNQHSSLRIGASSINATQSFTGV